MGVKQMDGTAVAIISVVVSGLVGIATPYLSSRAARRQQELEIRVEREREVRDVLDRGARLLEAAFWSLDRAYRAEQSHDGAGNELFADSVGRRLPAMSRGGARLAVRLGTDSDAVAHYDETQKLLRLLSDRVQAGDIAVGVLVKTPEWEDAVAAQKRYLNSAQRIVGLR
jgi:hypothetical protein